MSSSHMLLSKYAYRNVSIEVSNRRASADCHSFRIVKAVPCGRFLRVGAGGCNGGTLINPFSRRLDVPQNSPQLKGNEVGSYASLYQPRVCPKKDPSVQFVDATEKAETRAWSMESVGGAQSADGIIARAIVLTGREYRNDWPTFRIRNVRCVVGTRLRAIGIESIPNLGTRERMFRFSAQTITDLQKSTRFLRNPLGGYRGAQPQSKNNKIGFK